MEAAEHRDITAAIFEAPEPRFFSQSLPGSWRGIPGECSKVLGHKIGWNISDSNIPKPMKYPSLSSPDQKFSGLYYVVI